MDDSLSSLFFLSSLLIWLAVVVAAVVFVGPSVWCIFLSSGMSFAGQARWFPPLFHFNLLSSFHIYSWPTARSAVFLMASSPASSHPSSHWLILLVTAATAETAAVCSRRNLLCVIETVVFQFALFFHIFTYNVLNVCKPHFSVCTELLWSLISSVTKFFIISSPFFCRSRRLLVSCHSSHCPALFDWHVILFCWPRKLLFAFLSFIAVFGLTIC